MKKTILNLKLILTIFSLSVVTVVFGFACGPAFQVPNGSLQMSSSAPEQDDNGGGTDEQGVIVKAGVKTIGIPILQQQYASLHSTLQLTNTSTAARAEFNRQLALLSDTGRVETVSGSLTLATANLAAQVCLDKVNAENAAGATKTMFNAINLGQPPAASINDVNLNITINRLARSIWGRNETDRERTILRSAISANSNFDNNSALAAVDTRLAMVSLCTIMASSTTGLAM